MSLRRNKGGFIETTMLIYAGIAIGVVLLLGYVYHLGASNTRNEYEAKLAQERADRQTQLLETQIALADSEVARQNESADAARKFAENDAGWKGKVNKYVPSDPTRSPYATNGWVQYHDERASGLPFGAGPESEFAKTPSGIKEADALETVGDNYSLYFQCKQRVKELTDAYNDVEKIINNKVKAMHH